MKGVCMCVCVFVLFKGMGVVPVVSQPIFAPPVRFLRRNYQQAGRVRFALPPFTIITPILPVRYGVVVHNHPLLHLAGIFRGNSPRYRYF